MNTVFVRAAQTVCILALAPVLYQSAAAAQTYQDRWNAIVTTLSTRGITSHPKPGIYTALAKMAAGDTAGGLNLADQLFRNPRDAAMFFIMGGGDWVARYHSKMSATQIANAQNFLFRDDLIAANGGWWSKGTSENHHTMFAAGHYLTQQTFPAWPRAEYVKAGTTEFIRKQSDWICRYGSKEHDSPVYHTCHVNSWLSLADNAQDPSIRMRALMTLEVLLTDWAHEWVLGVWCASTLRTYNLHMDMATVATSHDHLAAGTGWLYWGGHVTPDIVKGHYCGMSVASSYKPPQIILDIGTDRSKPYLYRSSEDRIPCVPGNTKRDGTRVNYPAGFRKSTWVGKGYGIFGQYDGNGFFPGWVEQMMRAGIVWPNGRIILTPLNSPAYQMLIYSAAMVGAGAPGENAGGLSDAGSSGGWSFRQGGNNVYIASRKEGGGFAYQCADIDEYADMNAFKAAVTSKCSYSASGGVITLTTLSGDVLEIQFDDRGLNAFGGGNTDRQKINGERVDYSKWPRIGSPYAHCDEGGRYLTLQYDGRQRVYDFESWTVTDGQATATGDARGAVNRDGGTLASRPRLVVTGPGAARIAVTPAAAYTACGRRMDGRGIQRHAGVLVVDARSPGAAR